MQRIMTHMFTNEERPLIDRFEAHSRLYDDYITIEAKIDKYN